ncbi:ATP-dependent DNA helicase sgs1 [Puccinia graminis f. sp. tritici]|uniref:DNA 3'-5' helicase n=1 Tax=Puccinia graminis f. sp. tritici TaxID=56615 RepID=A0A5B0RK35_PUCGR|nr:ATP-dependent DNA helicase sgs1 [Puccinia graminis f. sp. tritici]KAA1125662.1 ATP-dependent DNA helicase sgs1 [Puccinia graminis f. sp. tritici]
MLATPRRTIPPPRRVWSPTGVNVYQKVFKMDQNRLREHIAQTSIDSYGQFAKQLQVEAVLNLVEGRNTFLLAGTGFGKSRIPELYYKMIPVTTKAVVLVLNPLDSLGDNQVLEKQAAGFSAINLTKLTFNPDTAAEVQKGVYQFVYLSPEIFLNSKLFETIYFSSDFQDRLALVVVDEAHMIYIWGLVESSTAKHLTSSHFRHEDSGIFRPSYGKLGAQLLFRNDKPILLLSATCRPVAVDAIKKSLKLNESNVTTLHGELTRPEIRMIRVTMENSLASSLDAIKLFPSSKDVPDDQMVPGLVYSGSRNRTLTVLEVIDRARETPGKAFLPNGLCARRFHSCTGDKDKVTTVDDFANGVYPVVSCTMALGLGQNWKRVRMVAHMGRGDPASICQMIGRCGRDGKAGLAVMFVEKTRRGGKNRIEQFVRGEPQNDLDRMDAMAITPLCLRVAFAMDNTDGYVPLWADDPNYLQEVARQEKAGMCACRCSNCETEKSDRLLEHLVHANLSNFDSILDDTFSTSQPYNLRHKYPQKKTTMRKRKFTEADDQEISDFSARLVGDLSQHYDDHIAPEGTILASHFFGEEDCKAILASIDSIYSGNDLRGVIGGDCFPGESDWIYQWLCDFKSSGTMQQSSSGPLPKKRRTPITNLPKRSTLTQQKLGHGVAPRPPTKKAVAAEAARIRSIERKNAKEKREADAEKRRQQVIQIMAETRRLHDHQ